MSDRPGPAPVPTSPDLFRLPSPHLSPTCPDLFRIHLSPLYIGDRWAGTGQRATKRGIQMEEYRQPCPGCGRLVRPYETEVYTKWTGAPSVHGCFSHCGRIWTHLEYVQGAGH